MAEGRNDRVIDGRGRLALALLTAAAIVLSSPWLGEFREWLRAALPGRFLPVFNATLGMSGLVAVALVVRRIHTRPAHGARRTALRYAALAGAGVVAVTWSAFNQHMSAETNAVERFHFLEYGVMTWLFYRAVPSADDSAGVVGDRPTADVSLIVLPLLAGVLVGIADEAFQWFVPIRVGEVRDILLNLAAVSSGLLGSLALSPPARFVSSLDLRARRRLARAAAAVLLALAAFLHVVHCGYRIDDPEIGVFASRYRAAQLLEASRSREVRWKVMPPPLTPGRADREDQFLFEANRHVQARNVAWSRDIREAWAENQILEKYFGAALNTPSYAVPAGSRWPDAQRLDADQRQSAASPRAFVSRVLDGYIFEWSKTWLWIVTGAMTLGVLWTGYRGSPRARGGPFGP